MLFFEVRGYVSCAHAGMTTWVQQGRYSGTIYAFSSEACHNVSASRNSKSEIWVAEQLHCTAAKLMPHMNKHTLQETTQTSALLSITQELSV